MKMTWGMKLFSVAMVMALMFAALHLNNPGFKLTAETKTPARRSFAESSFIGPYWTTTTREPSGSNLNRKMFTLSENGGILFRPPYNSITTPNPWSSPTPYKASTDTSRPYRTSRPYSTTSRPYSTTSRPYSTTSRPYSTSTPYSTTSSPYRTTKRMTTRAPTTTPYHTTRPYRTTRPTHAWTTASPFRGVSVCLRYLASYQRDSPLFILSPSTNPLKLSVGGTGAYVLQYQRYYSYSVYLTPYIRFWTNISPEIWNRVCLTFDNMKKVAQIFSGSNMSIRKLIPEFVWSGEPVIDIPGFSGQVTDLQVWDYPLSYKEVFNYMTNGVYVPYRGSVLTWSSISYSPRGKTLLEDVYEKQANQPINRRGQGRGRRLKGEKRTKELVREVESGEGNWQWLK